MKCKICGAELKAELAITESGWIVYHECVVKSRTEQEAIDAYLQAGKQYLSTTTNGQGNPAKKSIGTKPRRCAMTIERTVTVSPTPEELAYEVSHLDDVDQVRFLNKLAKIVSTWNQAVCFQLQYITDNVDLTEEARDLMEDIGTYARPITK